MTPGGGPCRPRRRRCARSSRGSPTSSVAAAATAPSPCSLVFLVLGPTAKSPTACGSSTPLSVRGMSACKVVQAVVLFVNVWFQGSTRLCVGASQYSLQRVQLRAGRILRIPRNVILPRGIPGTVLTLSVNPWPGHRFWPVI